MRWHTGNPNTDKDTVCVVQRSFKEEQRDEDILEMYNIAIWRK